MQTKVIFLTFIFKFHKAAVWDFRTIRCCDCVVTAFLFSWLWIWYQKWGWFYIAHFIPDIM